MRARFIAVACVAGLALAAIIREERAATPAHPAATARPSPAAPRIVVSARDRDAIYDFYGIDHVPGGCPPGLTKESYGCLAADDAPNSWTIGQPLSDDVLVYPLPAVLLGQVSPPNGYQYVRVGSDVLILGLKARVVAGALAGIGDR